MASNEIKDTNTTADQMPDISKWVKVWYADTKTGERTQIAFVEKIPKLEEAPDAVTGSALDLDYEFSTPGIKKASNIELDIYFTQTQHKILRNLMNKNLFLFFQNPAHTAPAGSQPLVRTIQGQMFTTMGEVSVGEYLKETITIYKSSDVEESDGFPTA